MRTLIIAALSLMLAFGYTEAAVAATAKKATYTISVTVGGNGKVTPKHARVKEGKNKQLVIKPKKKYMIDALIVNGVYQHGAPEKLGKPYILKLKRVGENISVSVTFDTKRNPEPAAEGLAVGSQVSVVDAK